MRIGRGVLVTLLISHILFVWGGLGFLGEHWIMLMFCTASDYAPLSWMAGIAWLLSTVSPLIGLGAIKHADLRHWYLLSIALTLVTAWFFSFMLEERIFRCDGP